MIDHESMPFTLELLNILIDPNLLFLLFLAGIGGIAYEVFHPGVILPGTLGAVSLILALFGFSIVPINWAGVALIVFGVALLVVEGFVTSHGLVGLSGVIALAAGGLLLFRTPGSDMEVSPLLVITISVLFGAGLAVIATKVVAARHQPVAAVESGLAGMPGREAIVRTAARSQRACIHRRCAVAGRGGKRRRRRGRHRDRAAGRGPDAACCPRRPSPPPTPGGVPVIYLIVVGVVLAFIIILLANSVRVLREYERGVVFRLGRLLGDPKGPGLFLLIPIIDRMVKVDLRIGDAGVPPQDVITRDNVTVQGERGRLLPGDRPGRRSSRSRDFLLATSQIAQTTLRSVLGQQELDELLSERDKLNPRCSRSSTSRPSPWGIKVRRSRCKRRRPAERHAARDGAAGRGRARAAGEDHRRRGRVPGVASSWPRRRGVISAAPDRAAAALPPDAGRDRRPQNSTRPSSRSRST